MFRVKGSTVNQSLDWNSASDLEQLSNVLGMVDYIKKIDVFSDRCGPPEYDKLVEEFARDLK